MLMVGHDETRPATEALQVNFKGARQLPVISEEHTSAIAKKFKAELNTKLEAAAKPEDDPVLVQAEIKYVGAILCDNEGRRMDGRVRRLTYKTT